MFAQKTTQAMIVAVLHDVMEDTVVTEEDLKKIFSKKIMDALKLLTHNDDTTYQEYIDKIKPNSLARAVKIADLEDNAPALASADSQHLVLWPNGCERSVPEALRYLSEHDRPDGGEQTYNSEHLWQLAEEIEQAYKNTQNMHLKELPEITDRDKYHKALKSLKLED